MLIKNNTIVRDYGFASYLITVQYEYKIIDGFLHFNISPEEYEIHNKIYRRNYQKKDKILRSLLKEMKNYK